MKRIIGVKQITTKELGNGNYPNGYKYMITPTCYTYSDGQPVLLIKEKDKIKEAKSLLSAGHYSIDEIHNSYTIGVGSFTI